MLSDSPARMNRMSHARPRKKAVRRTACTTTHLPVSHRPTDRVNLRHLLTDRSDRPRRRLDITGRLGKIVQLQHIDISTHRGRRPQSQYPDHSRGLLQATNFRASARRSFEPGAKGRPSVITDLEATTRVRTVTGHPPSHRGDRTADNVRQSWTSCARSFAFRRSECLVLSLAWFPIAVNPSRTASIPAPISG